MMSEGNEFLTLLSPEDLPGGFRYPRLFLVMAGVVDTETYYPWYFLPPHCETGREHIEHIKKKFLYPYIPFATSEEEEGYSVCFDGLDTSGDPEVVEIYIGCEAEARRYHNFEEWENKARAEAERCPVNKFLYIGKQS